MDRAAVVRRARRNQIAREREAAAETIRSLDILRQAHGQMKSLCLGFLAGLLCVCGAFAYTDHQFAEDRRQRERETAVKVQLLKALDPDHAKDYDRIFQTTGK